MSIEPLECPGCFGDFLNPAEGHTCETCTYRNICREVVSRDLVLEKITEIKETLKA